MNQITIITILMVFFVNRTFPSSFQFFPFPLFQAFAIHSLFTISMTSSQIAAFKEFKDIIFFLRYIDNDNNLFI